MTIINTNTQMLIMFSFCCCDYFSLAIIDFNTKKEADKVVWTWCALTTAMRCQCKIRYWKQKSWELSSIESTEWTDNWLDGSLELFEASIQKRRKKNEHIDQICFISNQFTLTSAMNRYACARRCVARMSNEWRTFRGFPYRGRCEWVDLSPFSEWETHSDDFHDHSGHSVDRLPLGWHKRIGLDDFHIIYIFTNGWPTNWMAISRWPSDTLNNERLQHDTTQQNGTMHRSPARFNKMIRNYSRISAARRYIITTTEGISNAKQN